MAFFVLWIRERITIMIKVGIYGASGYMGSEALRILLKHPAELRREQL
jgi:dihydrodipicolinate reductase